MRAFDGHNDVLSRLHHAGGDNSAFLEGGGDGHVDLPAATAGGLAGGLFAAFPGSPSELRVVVDVSHLNARGLWGRGGAKRSTSTGRGCRTSSTAWPSSPPCSTP